MVKNWNKKDNHWKKQKIGKVWGLKEEVSLDIEETLQEEFDNDYLRTMFDEAFIHLYKGFNILEKSVPYYMSREGQGDLIKTYIKKYKIKELCDLINQIDTELEKV